MRVWDVFVTCITIHIDLVFKILLPSVFKDTLCRAAAGIQPNKRNDREILGVCFSFVVPVKCKEP